LSSMEIPSSVRNIESSCFAASGLQSIFIPYNVQSIGARCFWNCEKLRTATCAPECRIEELPEQLFGHCSNLSSVTIPGGVRSIDESCFMKCGTFAVNIIFDTVDCQKDQFQTLLPGLKAHPRRT
jgi:hypothetical protein